MPIDSVKSLTTAPAGGEKAGGGEAKLRKIKEACREFEALFIRELLKVMRQTVPGAKSGQQRMYTELFDEQVSKVMAGRGMGLADMMASHLARPDFSSKATDSAKVSGKTGDK